MGWDETGPSEVEGVGEFPAKDAIRNTATRYKVVCKYPQNVTMTIAGGYDEIRSGTKWIGDKGWVWVDRGKIEASDAGLLESKTQMAIPYPVSPGHYQEFINSVKSRKKTLTPAEVALRSATPGWLGNIAMFTGRKLKWDAVKMEIAGDAQASTMLGRVMRAPWKL